MAKWMFYKDSKVIRCSECGFIPKVPDYIYTEKEVAKLTECPKCGVEMDIIRPKNN